jgi:hypothetical protein
MRVSYKIVSVLLMAVIPHVSAFAGPKEDAELEMLIKNNPEFAAEIAKMSLAGSPSTPQNTPSSSGGPVSANDKPIPSNAADSTPDPSIPPFLQDGTNPSASKQTTSSPPANTDFSVMPAPKQAVRSKPALPVSVGAVPVVTPLRAQTQPNVVYNDPYGGTTRDHRPNSISYAFGENCSEAGCQTPEITYVKMKLR